MPLGSDIVVTRPDSPDVLLVAEVKLGRAIPGSSTPAATSTAEAQLKEYMVRSNCAVGMLVTLDFTRIYRNRYTRRDPGAVETPGECRTEQLLGALPGLVSEAYLVERVEQWLESLQRSDSRTWPAEVHEAIESSVLPAVLGGMVRAAGPRWRRTGS
jgi:hypothetical protein